VDGLFESTEVGKPVNSIKVTNTNQGSGSQIMLSKLSHFSKIEYTGS